MWKKKGKKLEGLLTEPDDSGKPGSLGGCGHLRKTTTQGGYEEENQSFSQLKSGGMGRFSLSLLRRLGQISYVCHRFKLHEGGGNHDLSYG